MKTPMHTYHTYNAHIYIHILFSSMYTYNRYTYLYTQTRFMVAYSAAERGSGGTKPLNKLP